MKYIIRLGIVWFTRQFTRINALIVAENNRYMMTKLQSCGAKVHFHGKVTIVGATNIKLGDNVHLGNNSYLDGRGGITIGENTHISRNFVVHSSSHDYLGACLPYDDVYQLKPVNIGRNVWIGTNVVIVPGVTIGEGAIIGAGTVVSKSVPPLAIVGNQAPRILKYREKLHYERLDAIKSYGGVSGKPLNH
ncbi:MAG: acyltransferase [Cyanobacteria bacterium P01_G01_bin.39]